MKKALFLLLMLSACCTESNKDDCTAKEIANMQDEKMPQLLTEKDGVKVYWIKPCMGCNAVYFTTPCGDTSWDEHVSHGKTSEEVPHQISGHGCDK